MIFFARLARIIWTDAGLFVLATALSNVTSTPLKAKSADIRGPFVGPVAHAATFDGDVRSLPPVPAPLQAMRPEADSEDRVWGALRTDALDPVRQRLYQPAAMPALSQNFKGLNKVDNCTFWYTNEYYETSGGNWQTRIASFRYPTCSLPEHQYLPLVAR